MTFWNFKNRALGFGFGFKGLRVWQVETVIGRGQREFGSGFLDKKGVRVLGC